MLRFPLTNKGLPSIVPLVGAPVAPVRRQSVTDPRMDGSHRRKVGKVLLVGEVEISVRGYEPQSEISGWSCTLFLRNPGNPGTQAGSSENVDYH